jgi:hypothetical protein
MKNMVFDNKEISRETRLNFICCEMYKKNYLKFHLLLFSLLCSCLDWLQTEMNYCDKCWDENCEMGSHCWVLFWILVHWRYYFLTLGILGGVIQTKKVLIQNWPTQPNQKVPGVSIKKSNRSKNRYKNQIQNQQI